MGRNGKALDAQAMDNIILLAEKGFSIEQIGAFVGCGYATVTRVKSLYKAAQEENYASLLAYYPRSSNMVEWACAKAGISVNQLHGPAPAEPKPEKPDNTATAFAALLESIKDLTSAVNAIDKRLSAMQLTQQGFRGDVSEKIGKVIESVNVNGDIITKEHDKMIELLGSVKTNTKRRDG